MATGRGAVESDCRRLHVQTIAPSLPDSVRAAAAAGMRPFFPKDPKAEDNCMRKMDVCGLNHTASICDAQLRTYNTEATCHGPEDYYECAPIRNHSTLRRKPGHSPQ